MKDTTDQFSFVLKPAQHGVGVFTTHDIKKGTHLRLFVDEAEEAFESVVVDKKAVPEAFWGHCLERGDTMICPNDFVALPIGWYVNHSLEANAEVRTEP